MHVSHDHSGRGATGHLQFRLKGRSVPLDPRINAMRGDLADVTLAGILFAPHYARARERVVLAEAAFVRAEADAAATAVTQLLHGETFHVLDVTGDWAWGYCDHDHYVGYVPEAALGDEPIAISHRVTARRAPVFADADIKAPVVGSLSAGARLSGTVDGAFVRIGQGALQGAVHSRHLAPVEAYEDDWIAAAERQLGQPYVWGGRGHGGIDCSGLVQLALGLAGVRVPRDTDLQRAALGVPLSENAAARRGDIVFFPGHVGIMRDETHLLHANAWWMSTVVEPLADVIARLEPDHDRPVLARCRIDL